MFDIASLFAKQHPDLIIKRPLLSKLMINMGRWLWKEAEVQAFAETNRDLPRVEFIDKGFEYINFDFALSTQDIAKIPKTGRLILVANHPLGVLDGTGLIKKIRAVRNDVKLVLNSTLHTMLGMQDYTIPVDNFHGAISKKSLKGLYEQLDNEGVVMIFPAGKASGFRQWGVNDSEWNPSFIHFALKKNAPILPVFIAGRNSALLYTYEWLTRPLSNTIVLIREIELIKIFRDMFSYHRNNRLTMHVGALYKAEDIPSSDAFTKADYIRQQLYAMRKKG